MAHTDDIWRIGINVREYIITHYTPYDGDDSFLTPPTQRTLDLWNEITQLMKEEREIGRAHV